MKNTSNTTSAVKAPLAAGGKTSPPALSSPIRKRKRADEAAATANDADLAANQVKFPEWYQQVPLKKRGRATVEHAYLSDTFKHLPKQVTAVRKETPGSLARVAEEATLRKMVTKLRVTETSRAEIRRYQALHIVNKIQSSKHLPWDIRADAKEILRRWTSDVGHEGTLDGSPWYGMGDNLRTLLKKHRFDVAGDNGLVNGQWWPSQLTTLRDGAHNSTQGGIGFVAGSAALSLVLRPDSSHADHDEGHSV